MEWSKDRTMKLVELLQSNASLWNPSLCDTRRDKQKRKEELRTISEMLNMSVSDVTKKIQHLRTQYNREAAREARATAEDPNDRYVSNWYAFEYLHFMKDSSKPYRILQTMDQTDINNSIPTQSTNEIVECKLLNFPPICNSTRLETQPVKTEPSPQRNRDEFSVFGEYIANELRSLKGEKNLLVAKKKIQDVIFEVKMGLIAETCQESSMPVNGSPTIQNKTYIPPVLSTNIHIEPLPTNPCHQVRQVLEKWSC